MRPVYWIVRNGAKLGTSIICRIDAPDLHKVPKEGPLIMYSNHSGTIEAPILYSHLEPRKLVAIAKVETWDNWFIGWIFNLWGVIPINRGQADLAAMRASLEVLKNGNILAIAPEGTRNNNGKLIRAQPGAITLALRSGAPLQPVVHWGGEKFATNIKKLKRTDFHLRVGEIFKIDPGSERITREVRQQMVDEMMYRMAALLPEYYRGAYADLENVREKYLVSL